MSKKLSRKGLLLIEKQIHLSYYNIEKQTQKSFNIFLFLAGLFLIFRNIRYEGGLSQWKSVKFLTLIYRFNPCRIPSIQISFVSV